VLLGVPTLLSRVVFVVVMRVGVFCRYLISDGKAGDKFMSQWMTELAERIMTYPLPSWYRKSINRSKIPGPPGHRRFARPSDAFELS
jgi:hypothetical protein